MDAPPSPNHVFNFPKVEFEEDPQEVTEEEFEEDPEEDPEEELEAEAEDDVPPLATPPVGSRITPPLLSESSSDTEDVAPVIENEALEVPPIGSTYEERCEKKRKTDMEASSSEIREVKKRIDKMDQDLGDEMQFSNVVEHRVTELENKEQEKAEEMDKMKKHRGKLFISTEIMPPKMMKRKVVNKMVKKRIAEAIKEYERTRVNPGNASGSGETNTEKVKQVFEICKCSEEDKVMFVTEFKSMMTTKYCPATEIQRMEEEFSTLTLKGDDIEAYNNRFHELALMCSDLVPNEKKKIERYMKGFPKRIKGNITSARPTTLHEAVNLARELVEQAVQGKAARANENNKRKWEEH
nr:reverse transcriptase domain-containing protein [Tanacetum cinerariifolium]